MATSKKMRQVHRDFVPIFEVFIVVFNAIFQDNAKYCTNNIEFLEHGQIFFIIIIIFQKEITFHVNCYFLNNFDRNGRRKRIWKSFLFRKLRNNEKNVILFRQCW